MSLFTKLFEAVHSWRRRRGGHKSRKRSDLGMEQLDHRQLLAVNFTGVAATDFPATQSPGVVVIPSPANNQKPQIPAALNGIVNVSGFEIDQLRVSYDSTSDILSVGVEGPPNGQTNQEVIAADSDNNLNSGTVDPRVSAAEPGFADPPDMGGTKTYGIFLQLNDPTGFNVPDVVAGFPQTLPANGTAKPYEVAKFSGIPGGDMFDPNNVFPQYTGNYYLANDPNHPNFELQIDHFSQLYQQITGQLLTPASQIGLGAFGSNNQDTGISDEFFPAQPVTVSQATVPLPPPPVPPPPPPPPTPVSPTVFVNVHEDNHVNTAHPTAIRVNVLGSSGFDPTTIIPSTVRFGDPATISTTGATPILNFERNVNHDEFPDETFVFNGLSVSLPPGITDAVITGETTSGVFFNSEVKVFNRDYSYYTQAAANKQQEAWLKYDKQHGIDTSNGAVAPPPVIPKAAKQLAASMAINDLYGPFANQKVPKQVASSLGTAQAASDTPAPVVVSIPTKNGKAVKGHKVTIGSPNVASSTSTASFSGSTLSGAN